MQIHLPKGLSFGYCPGSARPPKLYGSFIVKGTFRLAPDAPLEWADEPDFVGGDLHEEDDPTKPLRYPSDFALFKPRADLIVVGTARAPEGTRAAVLRTGFSVGAFSKTFDARSESAPFSELALAHHWVANPPPLPKPRAELPAPTLAGFGPIPADWPERHALIGTYDDVYVKQRWPWLPEDFDYGYFNAAPRDQQLEGYLRGDEDIVLQHLDASHPTLRTKLPGLRVRCLVQFRGTDGILRYSEPQMRLDTLWIDADASKLVLVWRGLAAVRTPKMREVHSVVVVTEPLESVPRPAAECLEVLGQGSEGVEEADPAQAHAWALKFEQLDRDMADMADMGKLVAANEAEIAGAEAQLEGLLKGSIAELGPEAVLASNSPPVVAAGEVALQIKAALAGVVQARPELAAEMAAIDAEVFAKAEQEFDALTAAADSEPNPQAWTRERVARAANDRTPMLELDLSGLDLSGLDLSDQDFSGSRLIDAKLSGNTLVRTKLTQVDLSRAKLDGADLSEAVLDGADLTGADLAGALLRGVSVALTTLAGLALAGVDLRGATGKEADFAGADLTGARFAGARLPSADFTGSTVDQADFTEAVLTNATFNGASAKRVDFTRAEADGLRADESTDFEGACFQGIGACGAVFEASNLRGADFRRARLARAQFELASLQGANFDRADLSDAMFDDADLRRAIVTHANLLRASLEGADLTGADARGANGFEAGLWRAIGAADALAGANRKSTLLA